MKMEKKTILFYINTISNGGAERVILQLAYHFARVGYHTVLVTSFVDSGKEYSVPEGVIRLSLEQEEIKQSRFMRNLTRIRKLRGIIKQERPGAIIAFMTEPIFRVAVASIGLPVKQVYSVRNDPAVLHSSGFGRMIGKYVIPRADGIVLQTEDARSWFSGTVQRKAAVIFNEVSNTFFEVQRTEKPRTVVTFGRLEEQKDHKSLVLAFSKIAEKYPNEELHIYGSGRLLKDLQNQIDTLGLGNRIKLMGSTDRVPQILAQSKVFVLSSRYEGMPNALMEAMAVGVPCISTDCPCGGPKTLIENGKSGLLVPVGDVQALADAMDHLLEDAEYAELLGKNAKARAQDFKPDKVFKEWKNYVEAIG